MRADIEEYKAVENAAMKFVKSVAEGNSSYAKSLFSDEAVLFGYLNGHLEHGNIEQFYQNVDTVRRELGWTHQFYGLPAVNENEWRMEMCCKSI